MENKTFKFLEQFLNQDGISGFEKDIAKKYIEVTTKAGAQIDRCGLGSVIAKKGDNGPKLMLAAHMDEVGFVVQQIDKNGFLRISQVGGHWVHSILAMKIKVINREGKEFYGVIGSTSVHVLQPEQRKQVMKTTDVYIDLGFTSNEEVKKAGIDVGDEVVRVSEATLLADGDKYMAKAIDNRVGVAIIAKVLENLQNEKNNNQLFAVATAQEEVGLRGGKSSTQKIQPDLAIAIDTTASHDTPNIIAGDTKLGHGVAITMKDGSAIPNNKLANYLFDLAKEKNIPVYKYVSQGGGNDSGVTQYSQGGIPVLTISIPTRYLHTSFEVGSIKDFQAVVDLITEFTKKFNSEMLESFKWKNE